MAAAALADARGGSVGQVLMAAEIALEHHLGLTCDPVGGLVQVPCIERNAAGAMTALMATDLAVKGDPADARISFDTAILAMWRSAQHMDHRYEKTAEGGLALEVPVRISEC